MDVSNVGAKLCKMNEVFIAIEDNNMYFKLDKIVARIKCPNMSIGNGIGYIVKGNMFHICTLDVIQC